MYDPFERYKIPRFHRHFQLRPTCNKDSVSALSIPSQTPTPLKGLREVLLADPYRA